MPKKQKKLVVIDSNALLHRAWHAIPPLKTKDGTVVNAVFGYTSLLLSIIRELKPEYIIASFDLPGKTFRHEQYKEYKAQRVKQADEFYEQFDLAKDVLKAFNIPILTKAGFEADDVIGTISQEAYNQYPDIQTIIITGDLDALQLVNDRVKVLTLKRGFNDTITYDIAAVKERYGLDPEQLIDLKAIQGDASDNIKGVRGIGAKGATNLIKEFGSLENLYKKISEADIKERTKNLLLEQKDEAFESKELVTIVTDVPLTWKLENATFSEFDAEKVYKIFQELEFSSLLNKIPHKESNLNNNAFADKKAAYQTISNTKDFEIFYGELSKQKIFALDTETSGLDVFNDKILGMSFSWQAKTGFYIDLSDNKFQKLVVEQLKPILEDDKISKVGHHLKFDYKVFKQLDIELKGIIFDTLIAAYLINANRGLRLEELAFSYLGYKKLKLVDLLDEPPKKKKEIDIKQIPAEKLAWYAAEDADITFRLYEKLLSIIKTNKNFDLLEKMELPLIPVLAEMELAGISLDSAFLKKMEQQFSKEINKITKQVYKLAGREFNIASPLQLKEILFEELEISAVGIKKTKTGLSTAASELAKLQSAHPIIPLITEYRELAKLQSTYIIALPELVNKKSKRLHTNFNQAITATGRLSSSNPNLQNIPTRTTLGRKIRQAFVTPKNYVLLSADYSQIELRLVASLSKDPKMLASFKKGEDIHARTAAEIHKISLDKVTKEIRRTAKEVNFGILYGLGSLGLSQRTDLNRNEAKEFIDSYFDIYKKIKTYIEYTKDFAHQKGYSQTLFGRRRYLPDINSSMPMLRAAAERMAINMPVQGTSADLMKLAMIRIHRDLPKISKDTKMVLQVHDELVLEVPKTELKKVAKFVKQAMETIHKLPIPLTVDLEVGNNWGKLETYPVK
ncbi:DNA polymerase I [Candidatus Parcubacteria bacterium]|jgi:DNA polymerase I|nr:DNA polymerase I [Candidatus Parcubacteria bacterium]